MIASDQCRVDTTPVTPSLRRARVQASCHTESQQCCLMSWTASSSGDLPHQSGPCQWSCPHFFVAADIVRWSSIRAACFLIANRSLVPHTARRCWLSPFSFHLKRIRAVLSFHSLVSCFRPRSALSSALSLRGSPRCAFTLTRRGRWLHPLQPFVEVPL